MDSIPIRPRVASVYRVVLSLLEEWVTLPNIDPVYYHALGILLSVLYFCARTPLQKILVLCVVLLADWLDGATARQHGQACRSGYITDVVIDRISEAFIFAAEVRTLPGQIFFVLWVLNSALAFYSIRSDRHLSLPLRFLYILVLAAQGLW